ncbi:MAG TPA: hypothetical protein VEJ67_18435 [Candidatus Cybelea sp.]|nr:hypothetical protein [Candidatus Cybelea sp.]
MRFVKYLVAFAFALCIVTGVTRAQGTVVFLASGSSALFNELGQAAFTSGSTNTPCLWTQGSTSSIELLDERTSPATAETGTVWVTWGPGTGTCAAPTGSFNIYFYMSLDSVLGNRCYFEVNPGGTPGCELSFTIAASTAGANEICYPQPASSCTEYEDNASIPQAVISALNPSTPLHVNAAGTDIRPEDAKFASYRMFSACGSGIWRQPFDQGLRQVYGLGYQTSTNGVGTSVESYYSSKTFHVLDFNIQGDDPIETSYAVPGYSVSTVGAQPIIVVVTGSNITAAKDIPGFTLANFYEGVAGRTTDLIGPTTTAPVTVLVREPLSGTYNTFEWSMINNSQFHNSQDDNNCSGSVFYSNPMNLQGTNGQVLSYRRRVIGTSQMVQELQAATTDTIGYFFWSQSNANAPSSFSDTGSKYLTVNGVDPLQVYPSTDGSNGNTCASGTTIPSVFDGVIPGSDSSHPICNVTFGGLNAGDYPVWSALRVVSTSPAPAAVTNLISAVQTLDSTQHDFITLANLKFWHSHSYLPALAINVGANGNTLNPATPNDLCNAPGALAEFGNDAGGTNVYKQLNADFCSDFGNIDGLINKAN